MKMNKLGVSIGVVATLAASSTALVAHATVNEAAPPAKDPTLAEIQAETHIRIAGPDGQELKGMSIDAADERRRQMQALEITGSLGEHTPDEARAVMFVHGASEVLDDRDGTLRGYWVGRYYTVQEYEAKLPSQRSIVDAARR